MDWAEAGKTAERNREAKNRMLKKGLNFIE
jgi:hypothetical protein